MSAADAQEGPIPRPKVSVCVITYNQARYIRQCLQSVVDQQTTFAFELIVGDDCSTDGTREIVASFAQEHPTIVRVVQQQRNTRGMGNYMAVHAQARGEYVAHIDGDDLALPGKLQAQAQVLDADPACAVVWHRMHVFDDSGAISVPNLPDVAMWPDGRVELRDLLRYGSVSYHSSTMYRATARKTRALDVVALDWFFAAELLQSGHGRYLDGILGGYRYSPGLGLSRGGDGTLLMRRFYAQHLGHYLQQFPGHRRDIFVNCLINGLVDVVNRRRSWTAFCRLATSCFSLAGLAEFPASLRRYRLINPKIL